MGRASFPVFMDPSDRYPVGSAEWAGRISASLSGEFDRFGNWNLRRLIEALRVALPGRPWRVWPPPPERPWGSREVWCQRLFELSWKRVVGMIGEVHPDEARALLILGGDEDAELVAAGGGKNQWGRTGKPSEIIHDYIMNDNGTPDLFAVPDPPKLRRKVAEQGTSAEYLLRRLHKIARNEKLPDARRLAALRAIEGYRTGRLTSVRAAGIEAGIVKKPTALAALRAAWKRATAEERAAFLAEAGDAP
jgi:hypothetical protein